eukprot:scaffold179905_cov34-Tisochrysis_lutea.AAC.1
MHRHSTTAGQGVKVVGDDGIYPERCRHAKGREHPLPQAQGPMSLVCTVACADGACNEAIPAQEEVRHCERRQVEVERRVPCAPRRDDCDDECGSRDGDEQADNRPDRQHHFHLRWLWPSPEKLIPGGVWRKQRGRDHIKVAGWKHSARLALCSER